MPQPVPRLLASDTGPRKNHGVQYLSYAYLPVQEEGEDRRELFFAWGSNFLASACVWRVPNAPGDWSCED